MRVAPNGIADEVAHDNSILGSLYGLAVDLVPGEPDRGRCPMSRIELWAFPVALALAVLYGVALCYVVAVNGLMF